MYLPLHPATALILGAGILVINLGAGNWPQALAVLTGSALLLLLLGAAFNLGRLMIFVLPLGLVTAGLALLLGENLGGAIRSFLRILAVGTSGAVLIAIHPARMAEWLNGLPLPRSVPVALLVSIRFVPVLRKETVRIREAMLARGIKFHWYRPEHLYRSFIVPFMVRLLDINDALTVSLETRGFGLPGAWRSERRLSLGSRDVLALAGLCSLCLLLLMGIVPGGL